MMFLGRVSLWLDDTDWDCCCADDADVGTLSMVTGFLGLTDH